MRFQALVFSDGDDGMSLQHLEGILVVIKEVYKKDLSCNLSPKTA